MKYSYRTKGTCSGQIDFELENGIIKDVVFYGGCNGNLKGISAIVKGKPATEVIDTFKGITLSDVINAAIGIAGLTV